MKRYLGDLVTADLPRKLVLLTGPRQVGKTTLARQLMADSAPAVYLNRDVRSDRAVLQRRSWPRASRLVVLDEIHKMPGWKAWLKGVADARPPGHGVLVTGSALTLIGVNPGLLSETDPTNLATVWEGSASRAGRDGSLSSRSRRSKMNSWLFRAALSTFCGSQTLRPRGGAWSAG